MDMKQLRKRLGLETVDIASKLGKSESTIRNWETGRKEPTVKVREIPAMLEVYQCTLEELLQAIAESEANKSAA